MDGVDPGASDISKSVSATDYTFTLDLSPFGTYSFPAGIFQGPVQLDTGLVTKGEKFENQNPVNEPDPRNIPVNESLEKQISCSASISVNGGDYSHADALAQIKIFVVPQSWVGGVKQFSVKEAFDYPGAIR